MHIKSIVAGAAIALAATGGSASAADQFATLGGVSAESLSSVEMAAVVGADLLLTISPSLPGTVMSLVLGTDVPSAGLERAETVSVGVVVVGPAGPTCPPNCGF